MEKKKRLFSLAADLMARLFHDHDAVVGPFVGDNMAVNTITITVILVVMTASVLSIVPLTRRHLDEESDQAALL
jgi:hypothetical protein